MLIREATVADAEGIARVHVESWRTTYKGLVSEAFLSQLSVEQRKKNWEQNLHNMHQNECVFVALNEAGSIVGFSCGGKNRSPEFSHDGELYAIYILEEYQGQGAGKQLVYSVVNELKKQGFRSMTVWVLQGNSAAHFYTALGGKKLNEKPIRIGEEEHTELAYGWDDLENLLQ